MTAKGDPPLPSAIKDYESVLTEVEVFGRHQITNYVLIFLLIFQYGCFGLTFIFTTDDLNYRCEIAQCDRNESQLEYNAAWVKNYVPYKNEHPSKCFKYERPSDTNCSAFDETPHNFDETKCDKFVYENSEEKTILNEFGLQCDDNKWKLTMVGTVSSVGQFFGIFIAGYISDRWGRKTMMIFGMVVSGAFAIVKSFAWSYISFITLEAVERFIGAGVYSAAFVLAIEQVGTKHRRICGTVIPCAFSIGSAALGVLAMYFPNWRMLMRVSATSSFIFIAYIWLVPESIRWLIVKGHHADAIRVIEDSVRVNKITLSDKSRQMLANKLQEAETVKKTEETKSKNELMELLKSVRLILRLVNCIFCWIANVFVYYGLSVLSVVIGGNKYTNFIFVSLIDVLSYAACYFIADRIGRKWTLFYALVFSGISCILCGFYSGTHAIELILFLIGKFMITLSFTCLYVFTSELFPTNLRNTMMGICSTIGRVGSMIAPQTPLLALIAPQLPMISFGAVALTAGLLILQFPETLNTELPNTVDEAIAIGKTKKPIRIETTS